jgi:hypothetical protein
MTNFKKKPFQTIFVAGTLLFFANVAQAAPIPTGFIDNDTYTTDTIGGLDWLDLSTTLGQSRNQVDERITIGDLAGWRYAQGSEIGSVINNWTGDYLTRLDTKGRTYILKTQTGISGSISNLETYFGMNARGRDLYLMDFPDEGVLANWGLDFIFYGDDGSIETFGLRINYNGQMGLDEKTDMIASFLVRDTAHIPADPLPVSAVPLPAALPLYGAGLGFLGLMGWRKRRSKSMGEV